MKKLIQITQNTDQQHIMILFFHIFEKPKMHEKSHL